MSDAIDRRVVLPGGEFRLLDWRGPDPPVVFLHGLTGTADVWRPTVEAIGKERPHALAIDQRGHGRTLADGARETASRMANDVADFVRTVGLDRPHLCGHSMGGRIAIVAASRYPELFRSVAIVDIGPDSWKKNWVDSVDAFARMRPTMAAEDIARTVERRKLDANNEAAFRARFEEQPDGSFRALGSIEAMSRMVQIQRSANYWANWEAIRPPALLVRGGDSDELRPHVFAQMQRRNTAVKVVEFEGTGHNVPLLAPGRLAQTLVRFWREAGAV
ncbi:MAG: alpha/beta fold hydrolase [Dehalococcoidia bacterium]